MSIATSAPRRLAQLHRSGTNRSGLHHAAPMELEASGVAGAATDMSLLTELSARQDTLPETRVTYRLRAYSAETALSLHPRQ